MSTQSHIPPFEEDIFISYSHLDRAWVDSLHERLADRLAELLGERPKIWRDLQMNSNQAFADIIVLRLAKTAFLVSILSPGYVKSQWCIKELDEFYRRAAENGGIRINNRARIFKVVKYPIDDIECPPILQELLRDFLSYEFYERDRLSGKLREFRPELGSNSLVKFYEKVDDLVDDIKEFIRCHQGIPFKQLVPSSGKTIYLAETTFDLKEERDRIKRELQLHGHTVVPDKVLPLEVTKFASTAREFLAQSHCSIHLIGGTYGVIPEKEKERSTVRLQYELAAEHKNPDFFRLSWLPKGLQVAAIEDERQRDFISFVQHDFNTRKGDELLITKLEDLKTTIQAKLSASTQAKATPPHGQDEASKVSAQLYLICDKPDFDAVAPLREYLFKQGFEVSLPLREGEEADIIKDHRENLKYCDAALIYYGKASESWVRQQLSQLQKIAGYRPAQPLLAKAVYIAIEGSEGADDNPKTKEKESFMTHALVIKNYGEFSSEPLAPFLAQLQKAKGAGQ